MDRARDRIRLWTLLAATGVVFLASACSDAPPPRPNVLVIVVDTLRPDHLGCYGAERDTSPEIDRLASVSVRFDRAYATAPWTTPSVASMFTGLYPSGHGASELTSRLPDELTTLAEILQGHGYRTAGVISHILLTRKHNFHQGFDQYVPAMRGDPHSTASTDDVTARAQGFLQQFAAADEPFFLFAHYFDPHYNYLRHAEYGFAGESAGRLHGGEDIEELAEMAGDLTAPEVQFLRDLYDEEIRHTDAGIGRLLDTLKTLDLFDDTLIVLAGDHGEEFLEHGSLGHARHLYEEVIRVPFLLRDPQNGGAPRALDTPVSLVSLTPTILDLAEVGDRRPPFQAASLAPLLSSPGPAGPTVIFSEVDFGYYDAHQTSIIVGRLKLVRDDTTGRVELYDLVADPREREDLSGERTAAVGDLLPILDNQIALALRRGTEAEEVTLSEEELRNLRSLGYLGR